MASRLDPDAVKTLLAASADEVLARVLPGGKITGNEYRATGPDGSKWAVVVRGSKAGAWQCYGSAGVAGRSFLSLIRDAACQGDHVAAFKWALYFVGGDDARARLPPPRSIAQTAPPRTEPATDNGMGIYLRAETFDWDNPVGRYLVGRDIDPALFPRPPFALRYHPGLWNAELQCQLPAMVAPIIDPQTRQQIAIHRTWLERQGRDWVKAHVGTPKKVRGGYKGGVIPLLRGSSGKRWALAPDGDRLLLAEGIENSLSVAQLEPDWRACAYVAANNLLELRLPAVFTGICLVADRDGENWSVTEDRDLAQEQWRIEGREVFLWEPPDGTKDANDWIRETAHGHT
jgi:Toprim domain-containing protein